MERGRLREKRGGGGQTGSCDIEMGFTRGNSMLKELLVVPSYGLRAKT